MLFFILYIFNYGLNLNVCEGYHINLKKIDMWGGGDPLVGRIVTTKSAKHFIRNYQNPNSTKCNQIKYISLPQFRSSLYPCFVGHLQHVNNLTFGLKTFVFETNVTAH